MERKYELYHHGILGQKWGIRRFQNEDGSLTSAGKKRYQEGSSFGSKGREIKAKDAAELKSTIQDYKDRGDKETAKILQKHYNNLIKDLDKREVDFGEAWLKIIDTRQEINRITNQTYALSGLITNDSSARLRAATIARSSATYNHADDDYRTAVANYNELSRQIKQGRREQRRKKRD